MLAALQHQPGCVARALPPMRSVPRCLRHCCWLSLILAVVGAEAIQEAASAVTATRRGGEAGASATLAFASPPSNRRRAPAPLIARGGGMRLGPSPRHRANQKHLKASPSPSPPRQETQTAAQVREALEEALSGHKSCYTWALRGFAVDCLTELPSLLRPIGHHHLSWPHRLERLLGVASLLWKLSLAAGVHRFSQAFEANHRDIVDATAAPKGGGQGAAAADRLPALVEASHRHMGRLWRRTAAVVAAETAAEVARTLTGAGGGLPRAQLATVLGVAVVASALAVGMASSRQFRAWQEEAAAGSSSAPDAAVLDELTLRQARSTFRDLGLCSGALLARAAITPVRVYPLVLQRRGIRSVLALLPIAAALRTRLRMAFLLRGLRSSTWRAFREAAGGVCVRPEALLHLYESQARFFDRVGDVLREEAFLKGLAALFAAAHHREWGPALRRHFRRLPDGGHRR